MTTTHKHTFHLTAAECDATGHLPVNLLSERIIEVATEHANMLGIGYSKLITMGIGWVLSRLSVEMSRYPGINDTYSITTWIETLNRHFSERNMLIEDGEGHVIGYARTVWVAIDIAKRTMADLSAISDNELPVAELACPIARHPRLAAPVPGSLEFDYTFRYCDLDFNRHVNTIRYMELILNRWTLEHYDAFMARRIDITFSHECYFHDTVRVRVEQEGHTNACELLRDGRKVVSARIHWHPRREELDSFIALMI